MRIYLYMSEKNCNFARYFVKSNPKINYTKI